MKRTFSKVLMTLTLVTAPFAASSSAQVGAHPEVLDPNLATPAELQGAGLDPGLAAILMAARPFSDMSSLDAFLANELSEEARHAIYPKLFLPINLNHTTAAEIGLVPGMGPRMTHEFEEYRPYRGLAEFHREIGKYVDDEELARLAQFVFVPLDPNRMTLDHFLTISGVNESDWEALASGRPYGSMEAVKEVLAKHRDAAHADRVARYFSLPTDD